ncbi:MULTISPECIES: hypothetical protein [Bacillus]|uniref:hypothetical protein n=1 Tax=Bacillus TaxID=1386 RepID=UPI00155FD52C|nr:MULTISPECIES: hypothetical protein [Bacillus]MDH3097574.1 hypothetical protein [Bacillus safensis]MDI4571722.1 hypothetical protein [Bacillus altitudinis]NRF05539.1 hypothetical protein [Bacillus safensis]WNF49677.1 hypothetical protein RHP70_13315 [Bacillus sp. SG20001]
MPKQFNRFIKGVWRFLSLNLHTLLFLLGLILINTAVYMVGMILGIAASGVLLVFVAILLNHETERG